MQKKKSQRCGGIITRFFRFMYGQSLDEQLVYAVEKLVSMVIFEAMIHDYPMRYIDRLKNPYGGPNNTPEELCMQNFLLYRDRQMYADQFSQSILDRQLLVHLRMMETDQLAKGRKFAKRWMEKLNIKSSSKLPLKSWNEMSEIYRKNHIAIAVADFLQSHQSVGPVTLKPHLSDLMAADHETSLAIITSAITQHDSRDSFSMYLSIQSPSDASLTHTTHTDYKSIVSLRTIKSTLTTMSEDTIKNFIPPVNTEPATTELENTQTQSINKDSAGKEITSRRP